MLKKTQSKSFKQKTVGTEVKQKRKHTLPEAAKPFMFGAPGRENPGRPKGSRNKFAEAFLKDFLQDWEQNGKSALERCRTVDVAAYLKVASTLLPKEFNLNMTNEAELDKLLDQFNDQQLSDLIAGLSAVGAAQRGIQEQPAPKVGDKPDSLH